MFGYLVNLSDYENLLEDVTNHPKKWEKAIHQFCWRNRDTRYPIDLIYRPDEKTFSDFSNPGGNSWLNARHFVICRVNHEYDETPKGRIREQVDYETENILYILEKKIKSEIAFRNSDF